jgi:hypothetical protein
MQIKYSISTYKGLHLNPGEIHTEGLLFCDTTEPGHELLPICEYKILLTT